MKTSWFIGNYLVILNKRWAFHIEGNGKYTKWGVSVGPLTVIKGK